MEVFLAACCAGALQASVVWRDDYFDQLQGIVADGDTAYVAATSSGALVVNVTSPASPTLLGVCDTQSPAYGLRLSGKLLYVADSGCLSICDVSSLSSPRLLGTWDCPGVYCHSLDVVGTTVYIGSWNQGEAYIVDAADPSSPSLLGTYKAGSGVADITVSGPHMYVAADTAGLEVVDITDSAAPTRVGNYTNGSAQGVLVSGTVAYVRSASREVRTFDISDPTSPTLVGSVGVRGSYLADLALSGTTLYVSYSAGVSSGVAVVDVRSAASPSVMGSYTTPSSANGVCTTGATVLVACQYDGVKLLDASTPAAPALVGQFGKYGEAQGVHAAGAVAVVCGGNSIHLFNVSDPSAAAQLSSFDLGVPSYSPFIVGTLVFVGCRGSLKAVDITDPSAPSLVDTYATSDTSTAGCVWVEGGVAYVASSIGLRLYDVSDPTHISSISSYGSTPLIGVTVVGTRAYTCSSYQLTVLDVSSPANVTTLGTVAIWSTLQGVSVSGTVAYLAASSDGLLAYDVSNASAPTLLGTFPVAAPGLDGIGSVHTVGGTAYAIAFYSGLLILDVSDPTTPILLDTVGVDGARDVYAVGTTVYVASAGLRIINATPPTPTL